MMLWFSGFCIGLAAGIVVVSVMDYIDSKKDVAKWIDIMQHK